MCENTEYCVKIYKSLKKALWGKPVKFKLTDHTEKELEQRQIPRKLLEEVMSAPQQIVPEYSGRRAYQSKLDFGGGRVFLVRAIVDESTEPFTVVTVYRTSKVDKYWRAES